jgi:hypothetical protein
LIAFDRSPCTHVQPCIYTRVDPLTNSTNYLPKNIASKLAPTVSPAAIAALPSDQQTLKATNTELRRGAMLNLLQLGHQMTPLAGTRPPSSEKTASSSSSGAAAGPASYPSSTLFLTITVQRFEHGTERQLYRDDAPLLPLHHQAMQARRSEFAGHYEVLEQVGRVVEGGLPRSIAGGGGGGGGVGALKVYPPRSLLVLPSCPADVTLYLTVSKVTDWPRACILGQVSTPLSSAQLGSAQHQ